MDARHELSPSRAADLAALYDRTEYWAERDVADVREAPAGTDEAVALADGGDLLAAARVLTDDIYYAHVYDVVVDADRRGEGLGHRLMAALVEHPELDGVRAWEVACEPSVAEFYGEDVTDDLHVLVRS